MAEFKAGDVVVLKSGGPEMTVEWIGQAMGPGSPLFFWSRAALALRAGGITWASHGARPWGGGGGTSGLTAAHALV